MFSLGDGTKFWLYSKPTDMRKNFNMLSGIVNNCMQQNLYSGDVFVFVNASNNMLKLLRYGRSFVRKGRYNDLGVRFRR